MSEDTGRRIAQLKLEVLKARTHFRDPVTGLLTLPLVLERVRKLLDGMGRISVFQLSFECEQNLEERLGWNRYDELLGMMARRLQNLVEGDDDSSRTIVCQEAIFSENFLVFSADPQCLAQVLRIQDEGLQAVEEDGSKIGSHSIRYGRGSIIRDPKQRVERCIYAGLLQASRDLDRQGAAIDELRMKEIGAILESGNIRTLFQPIRRLKALQIEGFEALSRGPAGGYFEAAENLFGFAERAGLLGEVEMLCLEKALENSHDLQYQGLLFLNLSNSGLEYLESEGGGLLPLIRAGGVDPSRCVLEVTERTFADNPSVLQQRVENFRSAGLRIAIDDMGAGYSSLHIVAELKPNYIKLDQLLVRDLQSSPIKQNLVAAVLRFSRDTGSEVIAEGVEKIAEARVLQDLGIALVQGFHFGYPLPAKGIS